MTEPRDEAGGLPALMQKLRTDSAFRARFAQAVTATLRDFGVDPSVFGAPNGIDDDQIARFLSDWAGSTGPSGWRSTVGEATAADPEANLPDFFKKVPQGNPFPPLKPRPPSRPDPSDPLNGTDPVDGARQELASRDAREAQQREINLRRQRRRDEEARMMLEPPVPAMPVVVYGPPPGIKDGPPPPIPKEPLPPSVPVYGPPPGLSWFLGLFGRRPR